MQILDGKAAAQSIKDALKLDVAQLASNGREVPHLVAILVGTNGA
ncbi:MAG: bifunctional 5,10-methylene-tetrahydrofolate dehydrogenase/5,10-methylene-tetrahydrofolate cyclohydrolase, partial [Chitinophagaceae bacterium]